MAVPVASRPFHNTVRNNVVAENVSTVVASQADSGCFDSTAACAALLLSMTGVERINKVTHSQDDPVMLRNPGVRVYGFGGAPVLALRMSPSMSS